MRRPAGVACVLLLLLGAAPAGAQDPAARSPAIGGASFNAAPLLEPGRYRDTILPDEFLYYGVALQVGQRMHVRARIASSDADAWREAAGGFAINLFTPLRQRLTDPVEEDVLGNGNDDVGFVSEDNMAARLRWDFYGPTALPLVEALEETDYVGPGTWYLSFNLFNLLGTGERVAEFPVEFDIEVDGTAQTEPPDPTPEPTPTPTPGGDDEPAGDDGGGPPLGAVAALGAVGVAAGLVLGGMLGRRRRP